MLSKKDYQLITKIVERADNYGLLMDDRLSLIMDLKICIDLFHLKLDKFLNADDFNFCHDIAGIQNNLNRETKQMDNFFIPRFAHIS